MCIIVDNSSQLYLYWGGKTYLKSVINHLKLFSILNIQSITANIYAVIDCMFNIEIIYDHSGMEQIRVTFEINRTNFETSINKSLTRVGSLNPESEHI
jgi:hypothetical protein